jgi:hypothetical protein
MDSLYTIYHALWPLGLGLIFLFTGFRAYRRERMIADTPVSPAVGLALGPVALNGTAHAANLIASPFSADPCIFLQAKVWQYVHSGRSSSWEVRGKTELPAGAIFSLTDETGSVTVLPGGCDLSGTEREYHGNVDGITPDGEDIVESFGLHWGDSDVKVTEAVIAQDSPVYVLGAGTEASLLPGGAASAGVAQDAPVVTSPAPGGAPYLICTQGPVLLERRLGRSTLLQLAGAVALVLWSVGFIVQSELVRIKQTRGEGFSRAVSAGNVTAVKAALTNSDLNKRDVNGATALMRAARSGDVATVRKLLAAGADPNVSDRDGRTALHDAALARSPQTVEALLHGKAFVDIGDKLGDTPLHLAVEDNDPDVVRALVAGGEDPAVYNRARQTPLAIARAKRSPALVLALKGSSSTH